MDDLAHAGDLPFIDPLNDYERLPTEPLERESLREFLFYTGFWPKLRYFAVVFGVGGLVILIMSLLPPAISMQYASVIGFSLMTLIALVGSIVLQPLVRRNRRATRSVVLLSDGALQPKQLQTIQAAAHLLLAAAEGVYHQHQALQSEVKDLAEKLMPMQSVIIEASLQVDALGEDRLAASLRELYHLLDQARQSTSAIDTYLGGGLRSGRLLLTETSPAEIRQQFDEIMRVLNEYHPLLRQATRDLQ